MSTHIPVAAIQHRRFIDHDSGAESLLLASAVEGEAPVTEWHPVEDGCGGRERVVEKFLELWAAHGAQGLILYVADRVIRDLLAEQEQFAGLVVRDVVSGARLVAVWEECRAAFEEQRQQRFPGPTPVPAPTSVVIATDASRGRRGKLTGLGMVTDSGGVVLSSLRAETVLEGEFAAVSAALERYGSRRDVIDILTDSQKVWARMNEEDLLGGRMRGPQEKRCVQRVDELRRRGVTVRVHWVRGHNGHVLNDIADRAAVAARRMTQWGLDTTEIRTRLRAELLQALEAGHEFVPGGQSRDYLAAA